MTRPAPTGTDEILDRLVASALEAVVGVAAGGVKASAGPSVPPQLKPYLKQPKLSAKHRGAVRRIVEADDEYRGWVATQVPDELLDDAGRLWLKRPEGWETSLAELTLPRDDVDAVTAVRRAERRREAAEQATRRLLAEQVELRASNQALVLSEASARAELDELRQRCEQLVAQVQVTATELRHTQDRLKAAAERVDRAGSKQHEAEARAAEAERIRDDVLADRARRLGAAMDEAMVLEGARSVADELAAEVRSARQLGDALAAAVDRLRQLEPVTRAGAADASGAAPQRRDRRGVRPARRPIGLPGGVYGTSLEAAAFLVRYEGVTVLVDGYNVAKLAWPSVTLEQQRECCIAAAEDVARRFATAVHVVFDGADIEGASAPGRRLVRVQFSPSGVIADDVIRAEVAAIAPDRPVVVVTNDQAVANDVRAAGANVVSSEHWLAVAGRSTP